MLCSLRVAFVFQLLFVLCSQFTYCILTLFSYFFRIAVLCRWLLTARCLALGACCRCSLARGYKRSAVGHWVLSVPAERSVVVVAADEATVEQTAGPSGEHEAQNGAQTADTQGHPTIIVDGEVYEIIDEDSPAENSGTDPDYH